MTKTYDPSKLEIWLGETKLTGFAEGARIERVDYSNGPSWTVGAFCEVTGEVTGYRIVSQPVTRHSGRGGSLIPDSAFSERRWNRPTSPGHAPRDEEDADRERLQTGCYHRRAVRHEGSDE